METMYTYIYGLREVDKKQLRYIGKSNDPVGRLRKHKQESKLKKTHKDCWIRSCLSSGKKIEYIIIEKVIIENWAEREKYWINFYKDSDIVNHAQGGKGGKPIKFKMEYDEFKIWINNNLPNIKSSIQWEKYWKNNTEVDGITKYPSDTYKHRGWKGWGDLLNTTNKCYNYINYLNYEECKKILNEKYDFIKSKLTWSENKHFLENEFIPKNPESYFTKKKTWKGWGDFLNYNSPLRKRELYLSYDDAKKEIKKNFKNKLTVNKWRNELQNQIPYNIPKKPDRFYKVNNEWISWGDFLGTDAVAPQKKKYREFNKAKEFVRSLNIKNNLDWRKYSKTKNKPIDIPSNPDVVYKHSNEWSGWKNWLGTEK